MESTAINHLEFQSPFSVWVFGFEAESAEAVQASVLSSDVARAQEQGRPTQFRRTWRLRPCEKCPTSQALLTFSSGHTFDPKMSEMSDY